MSENENNPYFRHFSANNFFEHFFKYFSTESKVWNSAFFEFVNEKIFLLLLALFVSFDCKCAQDSSKKRKTFFYECVLEFN